MRCQAVPRSARVISSGWLSGRSGEGKRSSGNSPSSDTGNVGRISERFGHGVRRSGRSGRMPSASFLQWSHQKICSGPLVP